MKRNNFLAAIVIIGILLSLAILFVQPIEGNRNSGPSYDVGWGARNPRTPGRWFDADYDFPGNDMNRNSDGILNVTIEDCKQQCQNKINYRCKGIVTDFDPTIPNKTGTCWLKNKIGDPVSKANRYSQIYTKNKTFERPSVDLGTGQDYQFFPDITLTNCKRECETNTKSRNCVGIITDFISSDPNKKGRCWTKAGRRDPVLASTPNEPRYGYIYIWPGQV